MSSSTPKVKRSESIGQKGCINGSIHLAGKAVVDKRGFRIARGFRVSRTGVGVAGHGQRRAITCTSIAEFYFRSAPPPLLTKIKVPRNRIMKCSGIAFHRCLQPANTRYLLLPTSFNDSGIGFVNERRLYFRWSVTLPLSRTTHRP